MILKYSNIDPEKSSKDEIIEEIKRLSKIKDDNENLQMALKIFINSAYGAIGNQYFQCYNTDVAEAITAQGQDLLIYAMKSINKYFKDHWHKDTKLHSIMGITVSSQVINDVTVYGDTDSVYVSFEEVYKTVDVWHNEKYDPIKFIQLIYKNRLNEYFIKTHEMYAKKWNTENLHDFELEAISYSGIWLAKKKYVLNMAWKDGGKDGIYFEPQKKIYTKGIETSQSSYPQFARDSIYNLIKYIFDNGKDFDITVFMNKIKSIKSNFKLQNIENISLSRSLNDYEKYVLNDRSGLQLESKCPIQIKAAAIYNFKLNSSKYKNKYNLIKSGNKIKYYYVKGQSKDWEVFGYIQGNYPIEIAPDFDYDTMFEHCILNPINRFMDVIGKVKIPSNLVFTKSLW